jgi:exodeoxyribonuclease VII small subunit
MMATKKTPQPAEPELSYEQARDELQQVVQQLESGGAPLAEAMKLWERGEHLADIAQQWLDGAKTRVQDAQPDA